MVAAPDFKKRLISKEVEEGTYLRWDVHVIGDPDPKVTWYKGDVLLSSSDDVKIVNVSNKYVLLQIKSLYRAFAESGYGSLN